jgi:hypothetical protein
MPTPSQVSTNTFEDHGGIKIPAVVTDAFNHGDKLPVAILNDIDRSLVKIGKHKGLLAQPHHDTLLIHVICVLRCYLVFINNVLE